MRDGDARRWAVLGAAIWQIVTAYLWMALGWGRSIMDSAAESRTPLTPAGYAFSIWGVIFTLALVYAVWQALPSRAEDPLARRVAWPLAVAFAMNGLWQTWVTFAGRIGAPSVVIILVALTAALAALWVSSRSTERDGFARWVVKPLTGLLAGWLTAAAFVNVASTATLSGILPSGGLGATITAAMFTLAAGGVAASILTLTGSPWYAGAVAWALAAIVAANLGINQVNVVEAIAAGLMLGTILGLAWVRRPRPA
ncbi:hypothetical protein ACE7GA_18745 [Roseomonas sp. CCTCC AB2023176]|uniref:hypothetical protein n=1 Tax=Roseomonas sp. CCTCC AB2023176 TaxID=3342640 RepID=UPI0035DDB737